MNYYGLIKRHGRWFGLVPGQRRTGNHEHIIRLNHRSLELESAQAIWLRAFSHNNIQDAIEHDDGSMYIYFCQPVQYGMDQAALDEAEADYLATVTHLWQS